MKNTLINYGKHVDLHNNGKLVYVDHYKVGNTQLDTSSENLWSMKMIAPIENIDRKKSYYVEPNEIHKLTLEEAKASIHWTELY